MGLGISLEAECASEDEITPEDINRNHTEVALYESPLENMNGASALPSPSVSGFNHLRYSRIDDAGDMLASSLKWSSTSFVALFFIAPLHAVSFDLSCEIGVRCNTMTDNGTGFSRDRRANGGGQGFRQRFCTPYHECPGAVLSHPACSTVLLTLRPI